MSVRRGGSRALGCPARLLIITIDAILRHRMGIHAFSQTPHNIIRIARGRSRVAHTLSDGTRVQIGDPIIELHFWNEHLPRIGVDGPDLSWGRAFYRCVRRSLVDLACHVQDMPALADVVACRGELSFLLLGEPSHVSLVHRLGFDFRYLPPPTGFRGRLRRAAEQGYSWALLWAYQPASLRHRSSFPFTRAELWMSRHTLLTRYARPRPNDGSAGT